jgi:hypothetical protein
MEAAEWLARGYTAEDLRRLTAELGRLIRSQPKPPPEDPESLPVEERALDWIVPGRPLAEQSPFRPEDLRAVDFSTPFVVLSAPTQSGKSPALAYLALSAHRRGLWTLVLLNMNNNAALASLRDQKFGRIYDALGIDPDVPFVDDGVLHKHCERQLQRQVERLRDARRSPRASVWFCKASNASLGKLVSALPEDVLRTCVVMVDEVHCFFSLLAEPSKKAERNLRRLIFGAGEERVANLRVRSLVLSDATDADVPLLLGHVGCARGEFARICADADTLRLRGYVPVDEFELFGGGLEAPLGPAQRFGKDAQRRFKSEREAFARGALLPDFDPKLRAFFEDAFGGGEGRRRFLLEVTSMNKSESTANSVEHHAQVVARLFPDVCALAEHGAGCFHVRADGSKVRYETHFAAHDALFAGEHGRAKKYVISNLAYGCMTYGFPGLPVTHIYIGFRSDCGGNNLLAKAQALGRACTYLRGDLDRCGGRVRVLCTRTDFDEMRTGLPTYIREAYENYPDHVRGLYTTETVRRYQTAHRDNPLAEEARLHARVVVAPPLARVVVAPPLARVVPLTSQHSRAALHASVERDAASAGLLAPGALEATRVVRVPAPSDAAHAEIVQALSQGCAHPARTAVGRLVLGQQRALGVLDPLSGVIKPRAVANRNMCNTNPAHFGSRTDAETGEKAYRRVPWAYDTDARCAVAVLRVVPFASLSLPFVYHQVVLADDGSVCTRARLVEYSR